MTRESSHGGSCAHVPPMFRLSHTAEAIYTTLCEHASLYSVLTCDYRLHTVDYLPVAPLSFTLDDVVVHVEVERCTAARAVYTMKNVRDVRKKKVHRTKKTGRAL